MRSICLYFQVHQPFRLRTYRFFEMGDEHYYYDDYQNRHNIQELAKNCYLPANQVLIDLIEKYGKKFKISLSISGVALELFELYAPEVIESFQKLVKTKNVELVAEPYSHSLAGLKNKAEFLLQIARHRKKLHDLFDVKPKTFCNTELIYSDELGAEIAELGFQSMLTEGAKHILGWKSPNYIYSNAINPKLNVFMRNIGLSEDIELRFSDRSWEHWPLTAEKYTSWLQQTDEIQPVVNIFMPYEALGDYNHADSGIFDFLRALPEHIFKHTNYVFKTPQEIVKTVKPTSSIQVSHPISWFDEERDTTVWMGNEMQHEALQELYNAADIMHACPDEKIGRDWERIQSADNLFFMKTKWLTSINKAVIKKNYYTSPYDAFINYMNILSDLLIRIGRC